MKKTILFFLSFVPLFANADESGTCGENITWTYVESTNTLTISGSGPMPNYYGHPYDLIVEEPTDAPWASYRSVIKILDIKSGVTTIGDEAFYACTELTSVSIPNSVTSIGTRAFKGCKSLLSLDIPASVSIIGNSSFESCKSLTSVSLSEGVTTIGHYAFEYCDGLSTFSIPKSVTSIGAGAFELCKGLVSIIFSENITSIGGSAFYGCSNLNEVSVNVTDYSAFCNNKVVYLINTNIGVPYKLLDSNGQIIKDFVVPDGVASIGDYAFCGYSDLTSITIPESVTEIGSYTFKGCTGITSISLPETIATIGNSAFDGCSNLNEVSVIVTDYTAFCNNKVVYFINKNIGIPYKLYDSNGQIIKNFVVPDGVASIGDYVFCGYSDLTSITIPESVTEIGNYTFKGCTSMTSISLPESIATIGNSAFWGCTGLTSITIPESVTFIGSSSFTRCTGLSSFTFPKKVTTISDYIFCDCKALTSIIFGNEVTTIGKFAFQYCSGITSIILPQSVESIGQYAFENCSSLSTINLPENLSYIGPAPFIGCKRLSSVYISCSPTIINSNVFYGCESIKEISFDIETVTSTFRGFSSVEKIYLTEKVMNIEEKAFAELNKLTDVICYPNEVPQTARSAFGNSYVDYVTLHVPYGSVEKYKAVSPWKDFKEIVAIEGTEPIYDEKCETPIISFVEGILVFNSETSDVVYHYNITDEDIKNGVGKEIELTAAYQISVYASKEGYNDSDVKTAMLYWVNVEPTVTGQIGEEMKVNTNAILVQNNGGMITVSGVRDGANVVIYNISGQIIGQSKGTGNRVVIDTNLSSGDICIIKVGDKSVKYILR